MATWQHLRSSTANKRPTTSLADGRIAINTNTASPGLFFKDSAGTGIVKVGPVHVGTTAPNSVPAAGGSSGNYTGEQWLDTSVSPAQMKVWNGSTWVGIVADELPVSKLQDGAARQLIQTDAAGTGVEWTSDVDVPGTLDVTSTATFDSIAQHPLGTAGAPTITFTGDNNTGIYSPGADQVAISTGGSGRLFINSAGQVGVGLSPSYQLDVAGALRFRAQGYLYDTAGTSQLIRFTEIASRDARMDAFNGTDFNGTLRYAGANLIFETGSGASVSERARIDSSGRLGVGTSSPGARLSVLSADNVAATTIADFGANNGTSAIQLGYNRITQVNSAPASAFLQLGVSNKTDAIHIDGTGRVGVGTTSPGYQLDLTADINARNYYFPNTGAVFFTQNSANGIYVGGTGVNYTTFTTNSSERLRIDSSGRVGIGTSNPQVKTHIVDTNGDVLRLQRDGAFTGSWGIKIGQAITGDFTLRDEENNLNVISIPKATGRVGIGTTSPAQSLDVKGIIQTTGASGWVADGNTAWVYFGDSNNRVGGTRGGTIGFYSDYAPLELGAGAGVGSSSGSQLITFKTGTSERARIDSSGRLLVGTSSARGWSGITPQFQLEGLDVNSASASFTANINSANGSFLSFIKSRGTALNSNTLVSSGDILGALYFNGADGTGPVQAAVISAQVDGTPGANDMPGRLVFSTTADGASSPTERMRIPNGGGLSVGTTVSPSAVNQQTAIRIGTLNVSQTTISNLTTTWTDITAAAGANGLAFVDVYNTSSGNQGNFLVSWRGYPANATVISSNNGTGLTINFQVSSGKLQMQTTSGTVSGAAYVWAG